VNARADTAQHALDDATFERLVRLHRASLERFTEQLGASREDAEEIAATALLRAYQTPPGRLGVDWQPWLRTVARNLWIDMRRRRVVHLVPDEGTLERTPSGAPTVDQIAATADEARGICAAIALLPAPQRAVIYLREVRGLSYDEIALELDITLAAVTTTLHRARKSVAGDRTPLGSALGVAFAPSFMPRRGAGAARSASVSGVPVVATPRVSQPTTSGREVARLAARKQPARRAPTGAAPSTLAIAGAGAGSPLPSIETRVIGPGSSVATPIAAGTAPSVSPPATGVPAAATPADTRNSKAAAVSPGRSPVAPGRRTSAAPRSSRGAATSQQHRATGTGTGASRTCGRSEPPTPRAA
jgi:RNA polymerase sigma-70 factor (ECF subfamily)